MPSPTGKGSGISKSSDIAIRRLTAADAAAYRALRLRALQEHADAFTSSFEEESARPVAVAAARLATDGADTVWGAFVDGELAGLVGLGRETRSKVRHKATVFGMYVAAEHAGRGLGAALLQQAIATARAEALEQLLLTVTATNAGAHKLYEAAGFRPFGTEPRATRIGNAYHDKTHMILFLTPP